MAIYVVFSNYFRDGVFGIYTTIKRARTAFEHFLAEDENIVAFEDTSNYSYFFTTRSGEQFGAEIIWNEIDAEFEEGIVKEDE